MADEEKKVDTGVVQSDGPDALQQIRDKQKMKEQKDLEDEISKRTQSGELVIHNKFAESFIRGLNGIKEFFSNLFNPDGKPDVVENQGNGHNSSSTTKTMTENAQKISAFAPSLDTEMHDFVPRVENVRLPWSDFAREARKGNKEAYESLLKHFGNDEQKTQDYIDDVTKLDEINTPQNTRENEEVK